MAKIFDNSRKILSQEMTMSNMEALIFYFLKALTIQKLITRLKF